MLAAALWTTSDAGSSATSPALVPTAPTLNSEHRCQVTSAAKGVLLRPTQPRPPRVMEAAKSRWIGRTRVDSEVGSEGPASVPCVLAPGGGDDCLPMRCRSVSLSTLSFASHERHSSVQFNDYATKNHRQASAQTLRQPFPLASSWGLSRFDPHPSYLACIRDEKRLGLEGRRSGSL